MGSNTKIEWADHTINPWHGCHKTSAGCINCYMFRDKKRFGQDPDVVTRAVDKTFYLPLKWKEHAKVFVCSWSDFFIEEADAWRDDFWNVIKKTQHLTYLILTKRPQNIAGRLPIDWGLGWTNVWLGVTTENQEQADRRIPILLSIPSTKYFVSVEPMIGPVSLGGFDGVNTYCPWLDRVAWGKPLINWVICGGESGTGARPMHLDWARSLRDQCIASDVPFMFKQRMAMDGKMIKLPELDGKIWDQRPKEG